MNRLEQLKELYPGSWVYENDNNKCQYVVQFDPNGLFSCRLLSEDNGTYQFSILCNGQTFDQFKNGKNRQFTTDHIEELEWFLTWCCIQYHQQYKADDYLLNLNINPIKNMIDKLTKKE